MHSSTRPSLRSFSICATGRACDWVRHIRGHASLTKSIETHPPAWHVNYAPPSIITQCALCISLHRRRRRHSREEIALEKRAGGFPRSGGFDVLRASNTTVSQARLRSDGSDVRFKFFLSRIACPIHIAKAKAKLRRKVIAFTNTVIFLPFAFVYFKSNYVLTRYSQIQCLTKRQPRFQASAEMFYPQKRHQPFYQPTSSRSSRERTIANSRLDLRGPAGASGDSRPVGVRSVFNR